MSKLNTLTTLVSAGYPVWYAYGVSRGVVDISHGLAQDLKSISGANIAEQRKSYNIKRIVKEYFGEKLQDIQNKYREIHNKIRQIDSIIKENEDEKQLNTDTKNSLQTELKNNSGFRKKKSREQIKNDIKATEEQINKNQITIEVKKKELETLDTEKNKLNEEETEIEKKKFRFEKHLNHLNIDFLNAMTKEVAIKFYEYCNTNNNVPLSYEKFMNEQKIKSNSHGFFM